MDTSVPELNITKNDELEYIWDLFMRQIEPVAATTPYMVGNGNHEAWLVVEWVSVRGWRRLCPNLV